MLDTFTRRNLCSGYFSLDNRDLTDENDDNYSFLFFIHCNNQYLIIDIETTPPCSTYGRKEWGTRVLEHFSIPPLPSSSSTI